MNVRILPAFLLASLLATACSSTSGGSTPGSSGSSGSSGGAGDGGATGCDFGEPNDTSDHATPIDVNHPYLGLCVSNPDGTDLNDFFVMTAPSDNAGGYVEIGVSNVTNDGIAEFIVTSVADNDVIVDTYTTDKNAPINGWFTVAPGAKYRVQVNRFAGAGPRFTYDLNLKYTKILDTYEPNQTADTGAPLPLNAPIHASAAAVSPNTHLVAGDDSDWFKVTLAAGGATIKLTDSPADHICDVELFDASGQSVGESYTTNPGDPCTIVKTDLKGGNYTINAHRFAGQPPRGSHGAPPAFVTSQYTLEVDQ